VPLDADLGRLALGAVYTRSLLAALPIFRALVDLHLPVHLVARRGDAVLLEVDDEGAVRARAGRPVADGGALGLEVVPVEGEEGVRVLRGRQAGVGGIGRALGVAPELEPAVRRDGDGGVGD